MNKLKLGSELSLFNLEYKVKNITRKGVLFSLVSEKKDAAKELFLTLSEVEKIIFG